MHISGERRIIIIIIIIITMTEIMHNNRHYVFERRIAGFAIIRESACHPAELTS
jgi:hypothetical protein